MQTNAGRVRSRRPKRKVSGTAEQTPPEVQTNSQGADEHAASPAPATLSREEVVETLTQYLIQTGDQSVWDEAFSAAVRYLRYRLGVRCDIIAYHVGLTERSIYRVLEADHMTRANPLSIVLKACDKKGRSLAYLYSKVKGIRPIGGRFSDWMALLVQLGAVEERECLYYCSGKLPTASGEK